MKSAIYYGKKNIKIEDIPIPKITDNDVLIKNMYSSICGTDIAVYNNGEKTGHKIEIGKEFGHETISKVIAIGKNITEFKVGDIVYPYPRFAKNDTSKAGTIGGFSEYISIPNAKLNHSLYKLPPNINKKPACLIEPFTVGCRTARRANVKKGENAVVFGCGTIGIASAICLKHFGCNKVMICDMSDFRLKTAEELGFFVCNISTENYMNKAIEYFGKNLNLERESVADIDIYIDAAGSETVLENFMSFGKIDSRIVLVAVNNAIRNLDLLHLTYSQKSIIGSGGYMPEDVADVFSVMQSNRWNIEKIITHEYPIEELENALNIASNYNEAFNVIINFQL